VASASFAQDTPNQQRIFASPEAAVDAALAACANNDTNELIAIFGPLLEHETKRIDDAEEQANRTQIVDMSKQLRRIEQRSENEFVLLLGQELWPFPMPIVAAGSGWQFDTQAGIDELRKRRIGRNELLAIDICREYIAAQLEYAQSDFDGDGIYEYAQRILSTPGKKDGLYWKADPNSGDAPSPLGPFLAEADAAVKSDKSSGFMGYRFKILTGQGKHALGKRASYRKGNDMTNGFALVAWPVDYRHSGVMTFIVNHHGAVYEKDLGEKTSKAKNISKFDPDPTWKLVTEGL